MWHSHRVLLVVFLALLGPFFHERCSARSAAMRAPCSNCHTMHNSQTATEIVVGGPLEALMTSSCAACHTGANDGNKPFVTDSVAPSYDPTDTGGTHETLAGGSFYWVSMGSDLMGHNVVGVGATQVLGRNPPGSLLTFDELTCAGTKGCHGDLSVDNQVRSVWGSHHSPEESLSTDGSTLARSYRFLNGISGEEDPDWEYTLSANNHNIYKGDARDADTDPISSTSISHLCAKCHGYFHSGADPEGISNEVPTIASPWIRHPVDFDMGDVAAGREYAAYGDGGAGIYNVSTPLASSTIPDGTPGAVDLTGVGDDAIITCITCHRAHGSPYDYSLRWNYQAWPGGGLYKGGCPDCHTAKN